MHLPADTDTAQGFYDCLVAGAYHGLESGEMNDFLGLDPECVQKYKKTILEE